MVLDDCLELMVNGEADVEACLRRYPVYAARLQPMLVAAAAFQDAKKVEPSAAFKATARARLIEHMHSYPRIKVTPFKFALAMASLVIAFLATGTAFAQASLPGDNLYGWKLASERAWRGVASDPIGVDIGLAERRAEEVIAVSAEPKRSLRAQQEYQKALISLLSAIAPENESRIMPAVLSRQKSLEQAGLPIPALEDLLPVENDEDEKQPPVKNDPGEKKPIPESLPLP